MTEAKPDYQTFYDAFAPEMLDAEFAGSLTEGLNACFECVDRHPADAVALQYERADGAGGSLTFGELKDGTLLRSGLS